MKETNKLERLTLEEAEERHPGCFVSTVAKINDDMKCWGEIYVWPSRDYGEDPEEAAIAKYTLVE